MIFFFYLLFRQLDLKKVQLLLNSSTRVLNVLDDERVRRTLQKFIVAKTINWVDFRIGEDDLGGRGVLLGHCDERLAKLCRA